MSQSVSLVPSGVTIESATFRKPFTLPGLDRLQAPGTFEVQVRHELLDVSWTAHLMRRTILLTSGSTTEALEVRAEDLTDALRRDAE
jgi:hypothetical protein